MMLSDNNPVSGSIKTYLCFERCVRDFDFLHTLIVNSLTRNCVAYVKFYKMTNFCSRCDIYHGIKGILDFK